MVVILKFWGISIYIADIKVLSGFYVLTEICIHKRILEKISI